MIPILSQRELADHVPAPSRRQRWLHHGATPALPAPFKGFVAEAATRNVVVIVDLFDSYHLNRDVATSFCNGPRGA